MDCSNAEKTPERNFSQFEANGGYSFIIHVQRRGQICWYPYSSLIKCSIPPEK